VENKTEIIQHVLKIQQISLLPKYIKWISRVDFYMFTHANVGHLKVNIKIMKQQKNGCEIRLT
jgi:hypothetical protein